MRPKYDISMISYFGSVVSIWVRVCVGREPGIRAKTRNKESAHRQAIVHLVDGIIDLYAVFKNSCSLLSQAVACVSVLSQHKGRDLRQQEGFTGVC